MLSFGNRLLMCLAALSLWVPGLGLAQSNAARKITYVYTDPQGTPLAEADANGNITARFDYRPYGTQTLGSPSTGPGYTGHVNDADAGLVYMQARYYDPAVGRMLSPDPVNIEPGGLFGFNRYPYAYNNPVRFTDPDGRCPICIGVILYFTMDYANAPGPHDTPVSMSAEEKINAVANVLPPSKAISAIRTTVGIGKKATTIYENAAKGKAGEAITRAKLGDKIAGEQVTFKTSDGSRTRPDFVTKDGGVVETKTGSSPLTPGQAKLKADVEAGRAVIPVGNNATKAGLPAGQPTTLTSCTVDRHAC